MLSRFFINRPIFASVVSIIVVIAGLVTLQALPIAQYPNISPPTVQVTTTYPGANAQVLADTVASTIEEEINGVEGMIYMSSTCSSNGSYTLTVTFEVGTDMDMAAVLVQNRVSTAMATLPEDVKRIGVTTKKQSTNMVLMICLISPDGTYDKLFLSNYATIQIKDELARIKNAINIPLIANGDIWTVEDYHACVATSGTTDVMLGRGAVRSPDLARRIRQNRMTEAQWQVVRHLLIDFWHDIRKTLPEKDCAGRLKQWVNHLRKVHPDAEALWLEIRTERQCPTLDRLIEAA